MPPEERYQTMARMVEKDWVIEFFPQDGKRDATIVICDTDWRLIMTGDDMWERVWLPYKSDQAYHEEAGLNILKIFRFIQAQAVE